MQTSARAKSVELRHLITEEKLTPETYNNWKKNLGTALLKKAFFKLNSINPFNENEFYPDGYDINKSKIKIILAILSDADYRENANYSEKYYAEACKIADARDNNLDFELRLAEMITGDNDLFPYRSSYYLTRFFAELGFDDTHNGETRRYWVADKLKEKNVYQLHKIITQGLFNKKAFLEAGKNIETASQELKKLIENSVEETEPLDLSKLLGINTDNVQLFNKKIETQDYTINELISISKDFFLKGNFQEAVEKIWDAFERMKSLFDEDKKKSVENLIETLSNGLSIETLNNEFKELTFIGNFYQIRHYESNKTPLKNDREREYLYYRMLNLISYCSKVIENSRKKVDYNSCIDLTLGASGIEYKAPTSGNFYIKGISGSFIINNAIGEAIFPEGKIISVEKGDMIRITYKTDIFSSGKEIEFKFYPYKD